MLMGLMNGGEQGTFPLPDTGDGTKFKDQKGPELNFSRMLEQFYLNQCPPDLRQPGLVPPANLRERKQD